jgi:hypothetical protein
MADTVINGTNGNDLIQAHSAGDTLVLVVSGYSEDGIWPIFDLEVNGAVVQSNVSVTANNAVWETQQVSVSLPAGVTSIGIDYTNDAVSRNLIIESATLNGTELPLSAGTYTRSFDGSVAPSDWPNGHMVWGGSLVFSGSVVTNAAASAVPGNESIDGGAGLDTVVYQGPESGYHIAATSAGYTVSNSSATDTLANVERLVFSDVRVALDVHGDGGIAYRLYQAAFDRAPDAAGLGFQIKALDDGWGIAAVAKNFIDSPEFSATYGSLNNDQFVTQLYHNVLNRDPDSAGLAYHVNDLNNNGLSRADVLAQFSESPENQAAVIGVIQNGMIYTA